MGYGDVGLGGAGGVREWGAGGCWRVDEGVWDKAHAKNKIKNFAKFTKTKIFTATLTVLLVFSWQK